MTGLRRHLERLYWACERRIAPGLRYAQYEYEEALDAALTSGARWLDLGCGAHLLPSWRRESARRLVDRAGRVVGADLDLPALRRNPDVPHRVLAGVPSLPFRDGSFDLLTANMVVEHLDQPAVDFREVRRVLSPGGTFLFHTPNANSYLVRLGRLAPDALRDRLVSLLEDRKAEDIYPTRYQVNTPRAIRRVARGARLRVEEIRPIRTSAEFALFLPFAIPELVWLRLLADPRRAARRPNLLVRLRRPREGEGDAGERPDAPQPSAEETGAERELRAPSS